MKEKENVVHIVKRKCGPFGFLNIKNKNLSSFRKKEKEIAGNQNRNKLKITPFIPIILFSKKKKKEKKKLIHRYIRSFLFLIPLPNT